MGEVVSLKQANITIELDGYSHVVPILLIRRIMTGELSIAELPYPEHAARLMAKLIIEMIEGGD